MNHFQNMVNILRRSGGRKYPWTTADAKLTELTILVEQLERQKLIQHKFILTECWNSKVEWNVCWGRTWCAEWLSSLQSSKLLSSLQNSRSKKLLETQIIPHLCLPQPPVCVRIYTGKTNFYCEWGIAKSKKNICLIIQVKYHQEL